MRIVNGWKAPVSALSTRRFWLPRTLATWLAGRLSDRLDLPASSALMRAVASGKSMIVSSSTYGLPVCQ